ncbi:hypothetical protein DIPPA_16136 [Diplonema papillatum]|nr:hypothetical protein DIPPA_30652 [Diplonema papillatum]KAJ9468301.1 hypothetical protein DIPPA_16136 [Diplonema papillatum]
MACEFKAVDWSPIQVVRAPDEWEAAEEDVDCCVDCGKIHTAGAFCARCGKRGLATCLKAALPREVAPLFVDHLAADGWVCPACIVAVHQAGTTLQEEFRVRIARAQEHDAPPSLAQEPLLAAVEEGPVKTALLALFAQSAFQSLPMAAQAAPVMTEAVDPRRVMTWVEGLATAPGRQVILSEVKGRYAYHLVPENPHDAGSVVDHERRTHFVTLISLMPLAYRTPPILQVLHHIMVRLEALRLKCLHANGIEFQIAWETRFGSLDYTDFTKSALVQAQKAMADLSKKADQRDERREHPSKRPRK